MVILLILLLFSSPAFAETAAVSVSEAAPINLSNLETYEQLVTAIQKLWMENQMRYERQKVREAWETGKMILAHVYAQRDRANYGSKIMGRLAEDLASSKEDLWYRVRFARLYPELPSEALNWSHYRELVAVQDPELRSQLAQKAVEGKWTKRKLNEEIKRELKGFKGEEVQALQAVPGKLYAYQAVIPEEGKYKGKLALDLGFSNYFRPQGMNQFKEGDVIELHKGKLKKVHVSLDALYAYKAYVIKVIDGDTIKAAVDLGFEMVTIQKLRLRGLDTPELNSEEGLKAKQFLEEKIRDQKIRIRTHKSDKYGRFLADVFLDKEYINQLLIDRHLAWRFEE